MLKKPLAILATLLAITAFLPPVAAAPLTDFAKGKTALDFNQKPNLDIDSIGGKNSNYEWGITTALSKKYAVQYRGTYFNQDAAATSYRAQHRELNLIYEQTPHLQYFVGKTITSSHNKLTGQAQPDKHSYLVGVIGTLDLGKKYTLYTILGTNCKDNENVEFGLTYKFSPQWDLNGTYRHLTSKKIDAPVSEMELRGFGFGLTYKF